MTKYERIVDKVKLIIGITIIGGTIACLVPIPFPIDREMEGIKINLESYQEYEEVTIKVKGFYKWYLVRDNHFSGKLMVEDLYTEYPISSIFFEDGYGKLEGVNELEKPQIDAFDIKHHGKIYAHNLLKDIVIWGSVENGKNGYSMGPDIGYAIISSTRDYEEALEIWDKAVRKISEIMMK